MPDRKKHYYMLNAASYGLNFLLVLLSVAVFVWTPGLAYGRTGVKVTPKPDSEKDAQKMLVQGKVVDESNAPVSGALLFVYNGRGNLESASYDSSGLPMPVFADSSGNFSIRIANRDTLLTFIYAVSPDQKQCTTDSLRYKEGTSDFFPVTLTLHPSRMITGVVKDVAGKPVEGAIVAGGDQTTRMFFGKTDSRGCFEFPYSRQIGTYANPLEFVYAFKPGVGFDYVGTKETDISYGKKSHVATQETYGPFCLQLAPFDEIKILVTDEQNHPIPNVNVHPWLMKKKGESCLFNTAYAPAFFHNTSTGSDGIAVLRNVPQAMKEETRYSAGNSGNELLTPVGLKESRAYGYQDCKWTDFDLSNGRLPKIQLPIQAVTRGRVLLEDGTPVAHTMISRNKHLACGHGIRITDRQGKFVIKENAGTQINLAVESTLGAAPAVFGWDMGNGQEVKTLDIILKKGIKLHGVITRPDGTPVTDKDDLSFVIHEKELTPKSNDKQPLVCDKNGCAQSETVSTRQLWTVHFPEEKNQKAGYYQYLLPAAPRRYDIYVSLDDGKLDFERKNIVIKGDEKELHLDIKLESLKK